MDRDLDRLYEELTLNRVLETDRGGIYGGIGGNNHKWGFSFWYWSRNKKARPDVAWRDNDNKYHRLYGPAFVSSFYDIEEWYKHGVFHRDDGGPAVRQKNTRIWYKDGKLHRLDGPAIEDPAGPKQYWIDGVRFSPKQYKWEINRRKKKGLL